MQFSYTHARTHALGDSSGLLCSYFTSSEEELGQPNEGTGGTKATWRGGRVEWNEGSEVRSSGGLGEIAAPLMRLVRFIVDA